MNENNKLDFLKGLLKDELKTAILELSEKDIIIQKVIDKTSNVQDYINSITAAIICIISREKECLIQFKKLIDSNPELKNIIERNDK
jgi:hypothetical protein